MAEKQLTCPNAAVYRQPYGKTTRPVAASCYATIMTNDRAYGGFYQTFVPDFTHGTKFADYKEDAYVYLDRSPLAANRTWLFCDSNNPNGNDKAGDSADWYRANTYAATNERAMARHGEQFNMAFWDGHAESMAVPQAAELFAKATKRSPTPIYVNGAWRYYDTSATMNEMY